MPLRILRMFNNLNTYRGLSFCFKCQWLSSPPFREVTATLPINRLKQAKAFEITGVNFAGPLYNKHPTLRKKRKEADLTAYTDCPSTDGSDFHPKIRPSNPRPSCNAKKPSGFFSTSLAPCWTEFWERMVQTMKDLLRRCNGHACLEYDELEVSLIKTESVVNARPLTYVAEGSDDPLPITPNQFLNNRRSNCTPLEPAVNLMAPDAKNANLLEMDRQRREYVSDTCERFVTDYLLKIDQFHCKKGPGREIRVGEVVIIHDVNTKRLMWTVGVLKELITSRDWLIHSVMVITPNGNLIIRAIQSLHPLELREGQSEDVEVSPKLELESEQEEVSPFPPWIGRPGLGAGHVSYNVFYQMIGADLVSVTEASPDSTGFSIALNSSKAPNVALFPAILVLETDRLQVGLCPDQDSG
ncbi:Uncharacterized protein APZ42_032277 [Daphnia magna]|uniref:DUF5641 domain-containing protein n=1 Tax=Daphnia magna TaxID=35525 RepID=A0A164M4E6_9CRUS|nr:Uncharacterized protein APZ42_032277 [Daphnia magna]